MTLQLQPQYKVLFTCSISSSSSRLAAAAAAAAAYSYFYSLGVAAWQITTLFQNIPCITIRITLEMSIVFKPFPSRKLEM